MKINNHYVPRVYLKEWSSNNKIFEYELYAPNSNVPKWKKQSIKSTSSINRLYHYSKKGEITDEIEDYFSDEVENNYNKFLDKIDKRKNLDSKDHEYIAKLIANFYIRTLGGYKRIQKIIKENFERVFNDAIKSLEKSNDNKYLGHKIEPYKEIDLPIDIKTVKVPGTEKILLNANASVGKSFWIFGIRKIMDSTYKHLEKLSWVIYEAPENHSWPTSDDPVVFLNYYTKTKYDFEGKWLIKNTNIILPLSPRFLLFSQIGSNQDGYIKATINDFYMFQKFIVEHAFLKVYSKEKNKYITKIRKRNVNIDSYRKMKESINNFHQDYLDKDFNMIKD